MTLAIVQVEQQDKVDEQQQGGFQVATDDFCDYCGDPTVAYCELWDSDCCFTCICNKAKVEPEIVEGWLSYWNIGQ